MNHELLKTCDELRKAGADGAVLASVENVTYVTNVEQPLPYGALASTTVAPWLAIVSTKDERGIVLAPAGKVAELEANAPGFEVIGFPTFDSFVETDPRAQYLEGLAQALTTLGLDSTEATLAIESEWVPFMAGAFFPEKQSDAAEILRRARWIKTEREIGLLRRASHLADVAHTTLDRLCDSAGQNEIAMFAEISNQIFQAAGHDIPLTGELVTGPRSSVVRYPNGPLDRITETGDAALMDLSGRYNGYWFDCTNTHIIAGKPTSEEKRYANASQDACEAAMAALKPGAKASDAANAAEAAFAKHGLPMAHYAGHQIGVSVNELPRLVPYDHSAIEPGMVFAVEPGAYQGDKGRFGARSEKMVLVTESGPEILSTFAWGIS
ncbi:MAG TPA: Xaa-Pro peptidase family protein [Thermomicrobiales bacterium]|nr:Xaa-Pro peptidase family protein [Thermomicrobiales bacterium]